ncbi:MAG: carboxylesterase family protein, partial [Acidobacteriia bacterium]|nr:carboxylesterase family protein [Terriglobia bacterium]
MTASTSASRAVETAYGKFVGQTVSTASRPVHVFKGIPYGAAARFQAPRKPEPFAGVREAFHLGHRAPHPAMAAPSGPFAKVMELPDETGEDCLVLNVWTSALDTARRPVMVWLHG